MTLSLGIRRTAAVSFLEQGAPTTLVPALKERAEDELDGCADEMDGALKPVRPGTNGLKSLQLDGRFVRAPDGSLPSTPDEHEHRLGSAELERETRQLMLGLYRAHTRMCSPEQNHSCVVADILEKHQIVYKVKMMVERSDWKTGEMENKLEETQTNERRETEKHRRCNSMGLPDTNFSVCVD